MPGWGALVQASWRLDREFCFELSRLGVGQLSSVRSGVDAVNLASVDGVRITAADPGAKRPHNILTDNYYRLYILVVGVSPG